MKMRFFKNIMHNYLNSHFLKKMFSSFLMISSICIAIVSLSMLTNINNIYRDSLSTTQEQMITQAYNVNQTELKDIVSYCYTMMDDYTLQSILYGDSYSTASIQEILKINRTFFQISSLVGSVYFINFSTNTIIDHLGRVPISSHPDSEIFSIIQEMSPSHMPLFWYPRWIPSHDITNNAPVPVLTTVFYSNKNGALVLNIDYYAYINMLSLGDNSYVNMIMLDSNGKVMTASNEELFGTDYSQDTLYQKIASSMNNQDSFSYDQNGKKTFVKYIKNRGFGITYIGQLNTSYLYLDNSMLLILATYMIISLIFGFLLSILLSWLTYKPLRQLKSYINTHFTTANLPDERNDFDYLSNAYQSLLNSNTELRQVDSSYQNLKKQKLYKTLLTNSPDVFTKHVSELVALNIDFAQKFNLVLQLAIDPEFQEGKPSSGLEQLTFVMQNVTEEMLSSVYTVHYSDITAPHVTIVLNYDHPDMKPLIDLLRSSQAFLLEHFKFTFSVGVGSVIEDLTELSQSYVNADYALSRRFLTGNGSINIFDDLEQATVANPVYPYEIEVSLLNSIKALSVTNVSKFLQAFFTTVSAYSVEHILLFIQLLCAAIQRLEHSSHIETEEDWSYKSLKKSSLATIENQLTTRCLKIIEQLKQSNESYTTRKELVNLVTCSVNDNIYNPNLSVIFLANEVHISANYLRSIFKEETGESLSGYITQKKLETVCDLLLNSDLSLLEISNKLGFSTKNYFFNFFKKHTGMTPSEYRQNMKPNL